jgi:rhamnosyl/mannosyltransferase
MKNSDVLHFHYPWPFADLMNFLIGSKKPSILTYHSDIIRQRFLGTLYKPFLFLNLRRMHAVVATSPDYVQSSPVLSQASIRNKVRVIPLGVNDSTCNTSPDHSVTQRIGIKNREPYFLFIGVLRYYKGLDNLIRAALMVPAKVVIAGSGPERNRLIKLASKLRARNVIFSGQVTEAEKVALLQNSHAFVLPSHLRSEAFGMALIEAAKFGRPLISCDIGTGTSFVNQQEETGFVVPPQSPSKLAEALNLLLANIELGRRMGMAARKRYELLFSGEALGKAYAALYQEVASCK